MAYLRKLTGFYTNISVNNPVYSTIDKIFDISTGKKYSITDLSNAMFDDSTEEETSSKLMLIRLNPRNIIPDNDQSFLLMDILSSPEIMDNENTDLYSAKWTDLFHFIDILRENNNIWKQPPSDPELYTSLADELVIEEKEKTYDQSTWHKAALKYKNNTLRCTLSEGGSTEKWTFEYNYYNAFITITIYLDEDAYMLNELVKYKVYTYQDSDDKYRITNAEFDQYIVSKLSKFTKYKSYIKKNLIRYLTNPDGTYQMNGPNIKSEIQSFYIHTNLNPADIGTVSAAKQFEIIQKHLRETLGRSEITRIYPEFRSTNIPEIYIKPVYNNIRLGSGLNTSIINPDMVKLCLNEDAIDIDPNKAKEFNYEIIHLYSENVNNVNYLYKIYYPLIVVGSDIRPFSRIFPTYNPFEIVTEVDPTYVFRKLLYLAVGLAEGIITVLPTDYDVAEYDWILDDPANVKFTYKKRYWSVRRKPIIGD
jgi:hypothetical protein